MYIVGIDEAGRGPVIGPMVMVGVKITPDKESLLVQLGVKDSKLIEPKKRESMFNSILKIVDDYRIIIKTPGDIDNALNNPSMNLNLLEAKSSAEVLDFLKPDKAILDCPSNNIEAYKESVRKFLNFKGTEIIAEHKADFKYPIVGAASIIAKVVRDREIETLREKIGIDFGSGYPSDPKTTAFLKEYYNKFPEIFRKTWQSYKRVIQSNKIQKKLFDF